ncbi:MAG TPA: tripartite tricarboxylate transporter TctB family protein [Candidatus Eisenbacteria bacterium]|nr:tripartite tricarboxylate transporter TctB family protein [Candidatus Eisenbacteria bacterium]
MIKNAADLISGVCLAAFGAYVLSAASRLSYFSEVGPGPGFFPFWIGIGLVFLSFWLMLPSCLPRRMAAKKTERAGWKPTGKALTAWLAIIAAVALLERIGFGLSFAFLTIFLLRGLEQRPTLIAFTVAVGLAAAFYAIFTLALGVRLPAGLWGF